MRRSNPLSSPWKMLIRMIGNRLMQWKVREEVR